MQSSDCIADVLSCILILGPLWREQDQEGSLAGPYGNASHAANRVREF